MITMGGKKGIQTTIEQSIRRHLLDGYRWKITKESAHHRDFALKNFLFAAVYIGIFLSNWLSLHLLKREYHEHTFW